jgi:hypothetical protein
MSSHSIDLAKFDENFRNETPDDRQEMETVPDGKYQVSVDKAELVEAKTSGNPMLKWTLRIIAPNHIDSLLWRNSVITQNTLKYVKTDLHVCGLDLDRLSDLPGNLHRLLDVKLEITKRTKGDNENIFFNRRIETDRTSSNFRQEAGDALVPF